MPLWSHKRGMPIFQADEAASKGIAHVLGRVIARRRSGSPATRNPFGALEARGCGPYGPPSFLRLRSPAHAR
jgi:hypothetical protein